MNNLIRVELFKLRKNRSFWTLLAAIAFLSLAYPLLYYFDNRTGGKPQITGAEFLAAFLSGNAYVIKLGATILAGFYICNEYSTGVMKTIASSGNDRWRLFTAKLIVFSLGAMVVSLVFPIVSTTEASLLSGFGHLPAGTHSYFIPQAFGLTLLYSVAYAAVVALFAVVLTDSGKTIGISMIFFLLIDSALAALGEKLPFVAKVHDYSIFKLVNDIGKGGMGSSDWPKLLLVPACTFVLCGLLGILVFRRKEIK